MSVPALGSPDFRGQNQGDEELGQDAIQTVASTATSATDFEGSLVNTLTPYFHYDISSAVKVAERDAAEGTSVQRTKSISKSALEKDGEGSF
ncbi:hypothetical protein FRC04_001837 [Tulasnella sp. 424]|nr:hypothetical protein FRC04_001837 [Tulasnella sp. 424]KAG8977620.1 hypothetical protein FRC05_000876 [Tulasnella sp. 425]